jgi:hypothetical protein
MTQVPHRGGHRNSALAWQGRSRGVIGSQISATSAYHVVATSLDNQFGLALVTYVAPANGHVTRIGCFARQQAPATTRYVWLAIYDLDTNGEPLNLLGYTDRLALGGTAIDLSGAIIWSDPISMGR